VIAEENLEKDVLKAAGEVEYYWTPRDSARGEYYRRWKEQCPNNWYRFWKE